MLHDVAARMLTQENCNLLAGIGLLFVVVHGIRLRP